MPIKPPRFTLAAPAKRKPWAKDRKAETSRLRGRAAVEERRRIRAEEPLCRMCLEAGRITPTQEIDHIVPLAQGGADTRENKQGLCTPCHAAKSAAERQGGRAKVQGVALDPGG